MLVIDVPADARELAGIRAALRDLCAGHVGADVEERAVMAVNEVCTLLVCETAGRRAALEIAATIGDDLVVTVTRVGVAEDRLAWWDDALAERLVRRLADGVRTIRPPGGVSAIVLRFTLRPRPGSGLIQVAHDCGMRRG
jgi:hypothetical protein